MSETFKLAIKSLSKLSAHEKALIAHCLITSLDQHQDENVDQAWAELAERRYRELETGEARGLSWEEIKRQVKSEYG